MAAAGSFNPLIAKVEKRATAVEVFESGRRIGGSIAFIKEPGQWAEVLIKTSTATQNDATDSLLAAAGTDLPVMVMGQSTPLVAEAFTGLPVDVLAGTVPIDSENILKAVRHGKGTPALQRFSQKVYLLLPGFSAAVIS